MKLRPKSYLWSNYWNIRDVNVPCSNKLRFHGCQRKDETKEKKTVLFPCVIYSVVPKMHWISVYFFIYHPVAFNTFCPIDGQIFFLSQPNSRDVSFLSITSTIQPAAAASDHNKLHWDFDSIAVQLNYVMFIVFSSLLPRSLSERLHSVK